jgi:NAD(P)-dependent dehydrogenase (short-subunit alcohol dehydrogenase family)
MASKVEGKFVVLAGASRGIGRATARLFAERGASVVLAAREEEALLRIAAEFHAHQRRPSVGDHRGERVQDDPFDARAGSAQHGRDLAAPALPDPPSRN